MRKLSQRPSGVVENLHLSRNTTHLAHQQKFAACEIWCKMAVMFLWARWSEPNPGAKRWPALILVPLFPESRIAWQWNLNCVYSLSFKDVLVCKFEAVLSISFFQRNHNDHPQASDPSLEDLSNSWTTRYTTLTCRMSIVLIFRGQESHEVK